MSTARWPISAGPAAGARTRVFLRAASLVASVAIAMASKSVVAGDRPGRPTDALERVWPGHPEWLAMLAELVTGRPPEPGEGWYRKGSSRTRLGWEHASERFDADHDGSIRRAEYPGPDDEFARLDRDRDGRLTSSDCDFASRSGQESSVGDRFAIADGDDDGKLTRGEFEAFASSGGSDPVYHRALVGPLAELEARLTSGSRSGAAFLSLADFQEAFELASRREPVAVVHSLRPPPKPADRVTLFHAFLRRELGAFGPGPALGDLAPDFNLPLADGRGEWKLSSVVGPRPVVLIFGNLTCGPFRSHAGSLEQLYARYQGRVEFVMVYTRESHPVDGWRLNDDPARKFAINQPRDLAGRSKLASRCGRDLHLPMPVAVDSMDDRVGRLYSGPPSRLYLIDKLGKVAYKGGRGPFGFKPAELEQSLILLLEGEPRPLEPPDAPPALGELSPGGIPPTQPASPGEPIDIRIDLDWRAALGAAAVVAVIAMICLIRRRKPPKVGT